MLRHLSPVSLVIAVVVLSGSVTAQQARLDFADRIRLVDCQPSSNRPCFRAQFNLVDETGAPLAVDEERLSDLRRRLTIFVDDQKVTPFHAAAQTTRSHASPARLVLVLVDTSGSMNRRLAAGGTRFDAAKAALRQFIADFDDGVDRIAIVPFDSHDVAARIRAATLATTKAEAAAQIDVLPVPLPRNNTAIYSSVTIGLDVLAAHSRALAQETPDRSLEAVLVLMTDGRNEVATGDDAGLLQGAAGLDAAAGAVKVSGLQVISVGFGDPGSIDEAALRRIGTQYFAAADEAALKEVLAGARRLLTDRLVATLASPLPDRASLEGRTLRMRAVLELDGQTRLESGERLWIAPQLGVPAFEGRCGADELRAALSLLPTERTWVAVVRPLLVFTGLGAVLLALWFWLPRLIWSEQYIGSVPMREMRWALTGRSHRRRGEGRKPVPPGFESRAAGSPLPRGAADATRYQPQPDFSRSRLQPRARQKP